MFGHMKVEPILRVRPACAVEEAVVALTKATDETQAVRWIEFPEAVLVLVIVTGDPQSGALYILDRKRGTWLWVDFEDEKYGGYSIGDFEALVRGTTTSSASSSAPACCGAASDGCCNLESQPKRSARTSAVFRALVEAV